MGGIENASCNMANAFKEMGYEVYFFCIFKHNAFFNLNKNIVLFEPDSNRNQRFNILDAPFRIRKVVKNIHPDTILVFNKFYGALTLSGLVGLRQIVYISERLSPLYQFPLLIEIFNMMVFTFFIPTGIIAQTVFAKEYQIKYYRKGTKIQVIHNALRNVKLYDVTRKKQVLAVGRLTDYLKGFDRLIIAFAKVNNKDWKLAFAGGDEDSDGVHLKELAESLGILDRIVFLGKVKDIDRFYAESSIFVIPSRSEGFPNALIEAMAAGLPCISYDFMAGPREIITDGYNGILVKDGDPMALAAKIDFLIENKSEREQLGKNAMLIRGRLANKIICKQYIDFILPVNQMGPING